MLKGKIVPLKFRKVLLRQDQPVGGVYFPITCVVSLLVSAVRHAYRWKWRPLGKKELSEPRRLFRNRERWA